MKKITIYLLCLALFAYILCSCKSNINIKSITQNVSEIQISETAQIVSLTTPTVHSTIPTTSKPTTTATAPLIQTNRETMTMKSTENKKALKYRVAEDYTREYIADAMKDYNKYHSFYINNERYFIFDFAFNNKELKKKYGDDFDILTSGGGSGSLYYGATNSAKKGTKIREGSTYCYIVKHGANPGTGEGWRFDTSFYAKEGWKVEKFYFDQEGTDADRETWEKGWIKGFAIEILE